MTIVIGKYAQRMYRMLRKLFKNKSLTGSHGRKDMSGTEWVSELTMVIGR